MLPSHLKEFQHETDATFPILFDPNWNVAERYHSLKCPRSWVIDEHGFVQFGSKSGIQRESVFGDLYRCLNANRNMSTRGS